MGYDELGRRTSTTDPAGKITLFTYDPLGRLTKVTDALGQETEYTYDEAGNRLTQQDANGHLTAFTYDVLGRQTGRTLPGGDTESFEYDLLGNRTQRTDFNGAITTYQYDLNNRLTRRSYPDGSFHAFTYTPSGQRATMVDSRGTTSYAYDSRHRRSSMTYPDGRALEYTWDEVGNRTSLTAVLAAGLRQTTAFTYDELNRLSTVTDPQGREYGHTYDANGNRASLNYPNGITTAYAYDSLNRLEDITTQDPASAIVQSYHYTLGPAGNRTRIDEYDGTSRSYAYDDLYRLTHENISDTGGDVYSKIFTYDPVGNRLEQNHTEGVSTATAYTYDERDRLETEEAIHYGWDRNGNLLSKDGEAIYLWDFENRLLKLTKDDGTIVEYLYDADGVKVQTTLTEPGEPTVVTDSLVDTLGLSQVVAETDDSGDLLQYFVRGDDLLAVKRPGEERFYHADGLGSVRALTDLAGAVTDRWEYTAFGELREHSGADLNAYLFAGEQEDPNSGFYYLRARWMDQGVGRFASVDLFSGSLDTPSSLHKYLYAGVDPGNRIDPSGYVSIASFAIAGAIIGSVLAVVTFQPQGFLETTKVAVGGALAGAVLFSVIGYWAGASVGTGVYFATGEATATAAAGGATALQIAGRSLPVIEAEALQLANTASTGVNRIWFGHYGGRYYFLNGKPTFSPSNAGIEWMRKMVSRFGGRILNRIPEGVDPITYIKPRIDAADEIIFNASYIIQDTTTWHEAQYILSNPQLMEKTLWVTNATQ